jgi:hypothetical protein
MPPNAPEVLVRRFAQAALLEPADRENDDAHDGYPVSPGTGRRLASSQSPSMS